MLVAELVDARLSPRETAPELYARIKRAWSGVGRAPIAAGARNRQARAKLEVLRRGLHPETHQHIGDVAQVTWDVLDRLLPAGAVQPPGGAVHRA